MQSLRPPFRPSFLLFAGQSIVTVSVPLEGSGREDFRREKEEVKEDGKPKVAFTKAIRDMGKGLKEVMGKTDAIALLIRSSVCTAVAEFTPVSAHRLKMCAKDFGRVLDATVFKTGAQSCQAPVLSLYLTNVHAPDVESVCAILHRDSPFDINTEIKGRWSTQLVQMLVAWKVVVARGSDQLVDAIHKSQKRRVRHILLLCPEVMTDDIFKHALSAKMSNKPHAAKMFDAICAIHPLETIGVGCLLDWMNTSLWDLGEDDILASIQTSQQILDVFPTSYLIQAYCMRRYYRLSYRGEYAMSQMKAAGISDRINHALVTFPHEFAQHVEWLKILSAALGAVARDPLHPFRMVQDGLQIQV